MPLNGGRQVGHWPYLIQKAPASYQLLDFFKSRVLPNGAAPAQPLANRWPTARFSAEKKAHWIHLHSCHVRCCPIREHSCFLHFNFRLRLECSPTGQHQELRARPCTQGRAPIFSSHFYFPSYFFLYYFYFHSFSSKAGKQATQANECSSLGKHQLAGQSLTCLRTMAHQRSGTSLHLLHPFQFNEHY